MFNFKLMTSYFDVLHFLEQIFRLGLALLFIKEFKNASSLKHKKFHKIFGILDVLHHNLKGGGGGGGNRIFEF